MSYEVFARFYDCLIAQVDHKKRAAYFDGLLKAYGDGTKGNLLLDLGCGTGGLSYEMQALGWDVIGVDKSEEMLDIAMSKGSGIQFVCQDLSRLDMFGTSDAAVSSLDCVNHILHRRSMEAFFQRLRLFLRPGGLFVFDANTEYKHRTILGSNTFVYDLPEVFCVWQNETNPATLTTRIQLDFFEALDNGDYERSQEVFRERGWKEDALREMLSDAGFSVEAVFGEDTLAPLSAKHQRAIYVTRRI